MQNSTFQTIWAGGNGTSLEPDMTNAPTPPTGYYQQGASHPPANDATPAPGDPVTVTLTFALLPTPEEQAALAAASAPPPPLPDVPGFRKSIPLDSSVPASDQSALMADPRAGQFLWALPDGSWVFAQKLYDSMKATPGAGYTTADVESLGNLAVAHHIPITP